MPNTRFFHALKKINSFHNVQLSAKICDSFGGGWSDVDFYEVKGVDFAIRRLDPPATIPTVLEVAVSRFKTAKTLYKETAVELATMMNENELFVPPSISTIKTPDHILLHQYENRIVIKRNEMAKSMEHLASSGLPTQFHLVYLGHNTDGLKISPKGICDLYDFVFKNYILNAESLSKHTIKRFIGQMVLSVAKLHEHNLVSRDVKSENFIMYCYDDKFFIRLGDDSEIILWHELSAEIPATADHMAPELKSAFDTNDFVKYNSLEKKPIDIYALGTSLQQLVNKVFYEKADEKSYVEQGVVNEFLSQDPELKDLIYLIENMLEPEVKDRFTITQIMQNRYFGTDKIACDAYFDELTAEDNNYRFVFDNCELPLKYDKYPDNYFYILDAPSKNILCLGIPINDLIKASNDPVELTEASVEHQTKTLQLLEQRLKEFIIFLDDVISHRDNKTDYLKLRQVAIDELKSVKTKTAELQVTKLLVVAQNTLAKFPSKLLWTQRFFDRYDEIKSFQQLVAQLLKQAKQGSDYNTLVKTLCTVLGDKENTDTNTIAGKFTLDLNATLGSSIFDLNRELNQANNANQLVA